mmetsp:Transcript_31062/g.56348  ORF Transcript_31062/g.56348 Transcript_31062/m.56348 type:complete len:205 (+) Transcript_31062:268-882(+)
MFLDEAVNLLFLFNRINFLQPHESHVASPGELAIWIIHIGNPAAHSCTKVSSRFTQYDKISARHVLGTVVTGTLDYSQGTRISHTKALACFSSEECLTSGSSVETNISNDHIVFSDKTIINNFLGWEYCDLSSREALSSVIIRITFHRYSNSFCKGKCKRLACMTLHLNLDRVIRQAFLSITLGDFIGEHGTTCTVQIGNLLVK